jgi:TolB-like protein
LPFKNLSDEPNSLYFSEGMMDAILSILSKLDDIKVISRTSMEQYRESQKAIPVIAEELKVTHILEGSVQMYQNKMRFIVQLIDANEDQHLWSETYDRELTDVFEVQGDIAQQVASELKGELTTRFWSGCPLIISNHTFYT